MAIKSIALVSVLFLGWQMAGSAESEAQVIDTHNCYAQRATCPSLPPGCVPVLNLSSLPKTGFNRVRNGEFGWTLGSQCGLTLFLLPCGGYVGRDICEHTDCPDQRPGVPPYLAEEGSPGGSQQAAVPVDPTVWSIDGDRSGLDGLARTFGPAFAKVHSIRMDAAVKISSLARGMFGRGRYKLWLQSERYRVVAKTDLDGLLIGDLEASFSDRGYLVQLGFEAARSMRDRRQFASPIYHYLHLLVQPFEDQLPCAPALNQGLCSIQEIAATLNQAEQGARRTPSEEPPVEHLRYTGRTSRGRLKVVVQLNDFQEVVPGVRLPMHVTFMGYDRDSEAPEDFVFSEEILVEQVTINQPIDASEFWAQEDPDARVVDLDRN